MKIPLFNLSKNQQIIGFILLFIMLITRSDHFGSAIKLPDASLAVFFLAGLYLQQWRLLPLYLIPAGISDYVMTHHFGVSDFCITPAYVFLIPTYAAVWFAGKGAAAYIKLQWKNIPCIANWAFVGILTAFLISNGSFYLLSGYVQNPGWSEYVDGVIRYFPPYFSYTTAYLILAGIAHVIAVHLQTSVIKQQDSSKG